jgi:glutamine cyclotransferase
MTYTRLAVIAAKAGIPKAHWIPGRAAFARNDERPLSAFCMSRGCMGLQLPVYGLRLMNYKGIRKMIHTPQNARRQPFCEAITIRGNRQPSTVNRKPPRGDKRKQFRSLSPPLLLLCTLAFIIGCGMQAVPAAAGQDADPAVAFYGYEIVAAHEHDPQAFTQGLCFAGGLLYEGTGLYGQSTLRRGTIAGAELERRLLPDYFFGEGVTVFNDRVIQLTWQSRTGIVWERESLRFLRSFSYATEGWGLTHDGRHLIMSDGSATLSFLDPQTFAVQRSIVVKDGAVEIIRLNELEYVQGQVWANIWQDNRIAMIDPADGRVAGWIDLSDLAARYAPPDADSVLNGIAYDRDHDRIYVTGKRWSKIFEIRLVPKPNCAPGAR